MSLVWKAPNNITELLGQAIEAHHLPRLEEARFAVAFSDTKPFIGNRFNWGKVTKFTDFNKLWQGPAPFDFSIVLCSEVWHNILPEQHRLALLDLHLICCDVEYEPEFTFEGNRKLPVKDEWGRITYTNVVKLDDDGRPKWKVNRLDLDVFARNVLHYDLWMKEFVLEDTTWLKEGADEQDE